MVGPNQISFFEYWDLIVKIQWQFGIPTLLLTYLVTTVFYTEVQTGILFLYKDIDKRKVFHAKLVGLSCVLFKYMVITFIISILSFYTLMQRHSYVSVNFFPITGEKLQTAIVSIISCVLVYLLVIILTSCLSSRFGILQSILGGMLFMLLSNVSTELSLGKYLFPTGYTVSGLEFYLKIVLMILLSLSYGLIFYIIGLKNFKSIEF